MDVDRARHASLLLIWTRKEIWNHIRGREYLCQVRDCQFRRSVLRGFSEASTDAAGTQ